MPAPAPTSPGFGSSCVARRLVARITLAVLGPVTLAAAGVPEFHVAPLPPEECRMVGDHFVVRLSVDASAEQFNAYDITLSFEPSIVRLDSISRGQLMDVEGCGPAYFDSVVGVDEGRAIHSLLCADVAVDGPGVLSNWFFTAVGVGTSPLAFETDPDRMFADAGLWVWPGHPTFPRQVVATDSSVTVCVIGVDDPDPSSPRAHTRVWPNPWSGPGRAALALGGDAAPGWAEVFSVEGRRVWRVPTGRRTHLALPDLAPGTYLYRVRRGDRLETGRLVRVP